MDILKIDNIVKAFGENHVLNGVSLSFEAGKIYTLVGGNGAGKSTLYNLITGFLRADDGTITFKSKQIQKASPVKINHLGITRTFQDLRLITELSVRENILLAFKNNPGEKIYNAILPSKLFKKQYAEFAKRAYDILDKIHLTEVADNPAGEISYGQQKLLTIGCCIANNAELLLLDEPIAGIDNDNYYRIYNLLLDLKKEGKTIIQIEHNHGFVEELSEGIYFLYGGKVSYFENYNGFISDELVKKVYLT
nr:ATP-binding cassette domain-containing protein [uncultured Draconibacterium sp.]